MSNIDGHPASCEGKTAGARRFRRGQEDGEKGGEEEEEEEEEEEGDHVSESRELTAILEEWHASVNRTGP